MVPYLRDLPVTYTLNIGALSFSYKWFVYLPVVQVRGGGFGSLPGAPAGG